VSRVSHIVTQKNRSSVSNCLVLAWTAPSKTKDRMLSVSLLMGVESNSGTADARAAVIWPSPEVAARLSPLPNCSFMCQSFDSRIFELSDCFVAQSSPGWAILSVVTQGRRVMLHTASNWPSQHLCTGILAHIADVFPMPVVQEILALESDCLACA